MITVDVLPPMLRVDSNTLIQDRNLRLASSEEDSDPRPKYSAVGLDLKELP